MNSIVILITDFAGGGVSRMMVNLALGLTHIGIKVTFITSKRCRSHPYLKDLDASLKVYAVAQDDKYRNIRLCEKGMLEIVELIQQSGAQHVLTSMELDHELSTNIRDRYLSDIKCVMRCGVNYRGRIKGRNFVAGIKHKILVRAIFRKADQVLAVSQGVADALMTTCKVPADKIAVVPNPTLVPDVFEKAEVNNTHPWFSESEPVIVSVGRISRQKNFPLLIQAFASLAQKSNAKLIIVGGGKKRERLVQLVARLGLQDRVDLVGFTENPYNFLQHAAFSVLASRWEGSPNALIESLSLGVPVVATDCPSGPAEIIQHGENGFLVPVGAKEQLADHMLLALNHHFSKDYCRESVAQNKYTNSAQAYLEKINSHSPL